MTKLDYNFLGPTGVKVSPLCMGTMLFGGETDESTAREMYRRGRDRGINFFDCADVYQKGKSEEILGRLIKGHRQEVVITTKAYFPTAKDVNSRGSSRYHLVRAVEASLKRMNVEAIDLFFLHRFDDVTQLEETMRACDDLVRQGKVLYLGASNFAAWQVMKANGICDRRGWTKISCLQPMYNLVKRQAEVELLPMARAENIGVINYSPLGGGLLSGKYGVDRRPESGRLVDNKMYKTRYESADYYAVAERFTQLAKDRGHHPASLAIAFCASHPAITAPIVGGRTLEHFDSVLAALDVEMTPELRAEVALLSPAPPPATDRNEEKSAHHYGAR